jgi:hypothetical protein
MNTLAKTGELFTFTEDSASIPLFLACTYSGEIGVFFRGEWKKIEPCHGSHPWALWSHDGAAVYWVDVHGRLCKGTVEQGEIGEKVDITPVGWTLAGVSILSAIHSTYGLFLLAKHRSSPGFSIWQIADDSQATDLTIDVSSTLSSSVQLLNGKPFLVSPNLPARGWILLCDLITRKTDSFCLTSEKIFSAVFDSRGVSCVYAFGSRANEAQIAFLDSSENHTDFFSGSSRFRVGEFFPATAV